MPPVTREGQPWIQVYGTIPAVELLLLYFMENQPCVSLQIGKHFKVFKNPLFKNTLVLLLVASCSCFYFESFQGLYYLSKE